MLPLKKPLVIRKMKMYTTYRFLFIYTTMTEGRRGFLTRLFRPEAPEKDVGAISTKKNEMAEIENEQEIGMAMNRRNFLKGTVAASTIAASGLLEGCGPMLDSTPEGDWFNETREAFPVQNIIFDPEIEKILSAEGKANVARIISDKFIAIPKVFWQHITEVHVEKPKADMPVSTDTIVRIVCGIAEYEGRKLDEGLIMGGDIGILEEVVCEIGSNWYSQLSESAQSILASLSSKTSPEKVLAEGFKMHLLYPDSVALLKAHLEKNGLSGALGDLEYAYDELKENVFGGHTFASPVPVMEYGYTLGMLIGHLPGFKRDGGYKIFLEALQGSVDSSTDAFIDYALAENMFRSVNNEQYQNETTWDMFLVAQKKALASAQAGKEEKLIVAAQILELEAYWYKSSAKELYKVQKVAEQDILNKAKELFDTATDLTIKRKLAYDILKTTVRIGSDQKEICSWYEKNKEINIGTWMHSKVTFGAEACLVGK